MEQIILIATEPVLLTEQLTQQTVNIGSFALIQSGYANYHSNSTTNDSNALINWLENVVVIDPTI